LTEPVRLLRQDSEAAKQKAADVSCHYKKIDMIARAYILLPFCVTIPEFEEFNVYSYGLNGYEIRIYPLLQSENASKYSDCDNMKIDGIKAFNADILPIYFYKENFDRSQTADFDPPLALIECVANDFLARLRYVAGAFKVKPLQLSTTSINITYLNNDESELTKEKGQVVGRGTQEYTFSFVAIRKQVWADIHSLQPFRELPIWKNLLLDATDVLPQIGPSIVLVFTALEVFISKTLDAIAEYKKADIELWKWINNRKFFLKDPSMEEQFDFLSNHFIGKSLKDDSKLWEAFKNIQSARNSFAHNGIAKFGDTIVDQKQAQNFIVKAYEIINYIKDNLPQELLWPEFKYDIKLEGTIPLFKEK
jgi:hypothetical protein